MIREVIEITFGNAISQAKRLDECADSMERLAGSSLVGIKDGIQTAWEGSEASAYVSKMDMTSENILKTAGKIREIASTLRHIAQVFRASELKALEIAEQRTY